MLINQIERADSSSTNEWFLFSAVAGVRREVHVLLEHVVVVAAESIRRKLCNKDQRKAKATGRQTEPLSQDFEGPKTRKWHVHVYFNIHRLFDLRAFLQR